MKHAALAILTTLSLVACKPQDPKPLPAEAMAPAPAPVAAAAETAPAEAAPATDAVPAEGAAADATAAVDGEAVFKKACITCHGAGIAGAPKLGDAADWGPRAAQGDALLLEHALKGFTGKAGVMLPKGGRADLGDDLIKQGVDYLVSQAQ